MLQEEAATGLNINRSDAMRPPSTSSPDDHRHVFFKSGCMYKHQLLRINYMTYDVHHAQDLINPNTQHCDIMLLSNDDDDESHPFCYARVLGVYHVNVVYTDPGMLDYQARRLDFLWVCWFQYSTTRSMQWADYWLDHIHFPPITSDNEFGFVDPRDILRACHIIAGFASGKVHRDAISISRLANDSQDWQCYCVNRYAKHYHGQPHFQNFACRFADHDMLMRFHWGLAVGHTYTHDSTLTKAVMEEHSDEVLDMEGVRHNNECLSLYAGARAVFVPVRHNDECLSNIHECMRLCERNRMNIPQSLRWGES
jgi:hypothetical protein